MKRRTIPIRGTGWVLDLDALAEGLRFIPLEGRCGALTRGGYPCRQEPVAGEDGKPRNGRCHWHGGKSTGPTTDAGRAAIAVSNRRRRYARPHEWG